MRKRNVLLIFAAMALVGCGVIALEPGASDRISKAVLPLVAATNLRQSYMCEASVTPVPRDTLCEVVVARSAAAWLKSEASMLLRLGWGHAQIGTDGPTSPRTGTTLPDPLRLGDPEANVALDGPHGYYAVFEPSSPAGAYAANSTLSIIGVTAPPGLGQREVVAITIHRGRAPNFGW